MPVCSAAYQQVQLAQTFESKQCKNRHHLSLGLRRLNWASGRSAPPHLGSAAAAGVLMQKAKLPSVFQYTVFTLALPPAGMQDSLGLGWSCCEECHCCSRHILPGSPPQSRGEDTHWQPYFKFQAISAVFSSVNATE